MCVFVIDNATLAKNITRAGITLMKIEIFNHDQIRYFMSMPVSNAGRCYIFGATQNPVLSKYITDQVAKRTWVAANTGNKAANQ